MMSPQSRGRKRKPGQRSRGGQRREDPLAGLLRGVTPLVVGGDPLQLEDFVSTLLGGLYEPLAACDEPDPVLALIEQVGRRHTVPARALLQTVSVLGWTDEQRVAARTAADALTTAAHHTPPWLAQLADLTCESCWQLSDVFGDQASLICAFERGGARHGLLALLDFNHAGGWVKDLSVIDDVDGAIDNMRNALDDELTLLEQIPFERARQLLEDGMEVTDTTIGADVGDDYAGYRALALARCRSMPGPAERAEPAEYTESERDALVDRFLGAAVVPDRDAARYCARLLVDYGCDYDNGQPLRVGPAKIETFLLGYLPRKVILGEADRELLPEVVRAFCRWAVAEGQLPDAAKREMDEALDAICAEFSDEYDDADNQSPMRAALADLDESMGIAGLQEVLDRRMFAMPYFGTRIGDEDFPRLDPNDEDDLGMLILGEHPEFHEALADPAFEGEIDGVNPRLHLAIDQIVITQLWHDDPPQAWSAAQRLSETGMDRLDVIHELGRAVTEQLWDALQTDEPIDADAYAEALDRVAAPPAAKTSTPRKSKGAGRPKSSSAQVLRVKVTLRGARPPIWRRLQLPDSTTLAGLHDVLQAAFGWADEHLHMFEVDRERYAPKAFQLDHTRASDRVRLSSVCSVPKAKLSYEYDLGDSWIHDLVVEEVIPDDGRQHAVCLAGRRAAPAEDSGGIGGWAHLCEVLADPSHPEYAELSDWLGYRPDPEHFDLDEINAALARVSLR